MVAKNRFVFWGFLSSPAKIWYSQFNKSSFQPFANKALIESGLVQKNLDFSVVSSYVLSGIGSKVPSSPTIKTLK